jgi:hypothetical protein
LPDGIRDYLIANSLGFSNVRYFEAIRCIAVTPVRTVFGWKMVEKTLPSFWCRDPSESRFFDVTEMHTFVPIACLSNPRYLEGLL